MGIMSTPDPDEELTPGMVAALLAALEPLPPANAAAIKARVMARVAETVEGVTVVRSTAGEWISYAPGMDVKVLFDDGRTRTWLARLEAETRLPGHDHPLAEECLLLEGSAYMGDVFVKAGDYLRASAGTRHTGVYTPNGCVLLVRSASPAVIA